MSCNQKKVLDTEPNESSVLHEVKMAVISYSMRGNVFGQFGRILTKEKKQFMKVRANKINAQAHIDKLLGSKKTKLS